MFVQSGKLVWANGFSGRLGTGAGSDVGLDNKLISEACAGVFFFVRIKFDIPLSVSPPDKAGSFGFVFSPQYVLMGFSPEMIYGLHGFNSLGEHLVWCEG